MDIAAGLSDGYAWRKTAHALPHIRVCDRRYE